MADLAPKVKEVREKFLSKYDGSVLDDTYHAKDVEWVKKSDALIRNALKAFKTGGDVNKAVDLLNDILLFRAKYKLNDINETDLDEELRGLRAAYFHGKDKQGHKILHFRIAALKNGYKLRETKQIIAFYLNLHYLESPEEQLTTFWDLTDAGVSNVDLQFARFIINCLNIYFPKISACMLVFRLGVTLEALWAIVKTWLDADLAKSIHFVKRSNVQEYVAQDQLLPHMIKTE